MMVVPLGLEAQAARALVEAALDGVGRPWSGRLSLWIDALLILEESAIAWLFVEEAG
jgi:hypothetical protein